jgi:hypothetical protein
LHGFEGRGEDGPFLWRALSDGRKTSSLPPTLEGLPLRTANGLESTASILELKKIEYEYEFD